MSDKIDLPIPPQESKGITASDIKKYLKENFFDIMRALLTVMLIINAFIFGQAYALDQIKYAHDVYVLTSFSKLYSIEFAEMKNAYCNMVGT